MTEVEQRQEFKKRYLTYSARRVFISSVTMFIPLMLVSLFIDDEFKWERVLYYAVSSIVFGFSEIALQRYFLKKGKMYLPPSKFGNKT
ncbi:MAG: hypothetical protein RLZZ337_617 [Bacteroidota bacterium]|jgi:hypothetical protein